MKRVALLVGVDQYDRDATIRSLDYAVADCVKLHSFLVGAGYRVEHLLQHRVTQSAVLDTASRLVSELHPGDLFLFYFSGHGYQHLNEHLLLCSDAVYTRLSSNMGGVPVGLLRDETNRKGIQRAFIIDACRSDLLRAKGPGHGMVGSGNLRNIVTKLKRDEPTVGSFSLMWSCEDGQQSLESPQLGQGIFTASLLQLMGEKHEAGEPVCLDTSFRISLEKRMRELAKTCGGIPDQRPCSEDVGDPIVVIAGRASRLYMERRYATASKAESECRSSSTSGADSTETPKREPVEKVLDAHKKGAKRPLGTRLAPLIAVVAAFTFATYFGFLPIQGWFGLQEDKADLPPIPASSRQVPSNTIDSDSATKLPANDQHPVLVIGSEAVIPPVKVDWESDARQAARMKDDADFRQFAENRLQDWHQGAVRKIAPAIWLVGLCNQKGVGVRQDPDAAFRCFLESAELGFAPAQVSVGLCYSNASGVAPKDDAQAVQWFRKAAAQDYPDAKILLSTHPVDRVGEVTKSTESDMPADKPVGGGVRQSDGKGPTAHAAAEVPAQTDLIKDLFQRFKDEAKTAPGPANTQQKEMLEKSAKIGEMAFETQVHKVAEGVTSLPDVSGVPKTSTMAPEAGAQKAVEESNVLQPRHETARKEAEPIVAPKEDARLARERAAASLAKERLDRIAGGRARVLVSPFENVSGVRCLLPYAITRGGASRELKVDRYSELPRALMEDILAQGTRLAIIDRQQVDAALVDADHATLVAIKDAERGIAYGRQLEADRIIVGTILRIATEERKVKAYGISAHNILVTASIRIRELDSENGQVVVSQIFEARETYAASQFGGVTSGDVAQQIIDSVLKKVREDKTFIQSLAKPTDSSKRP